MDLQFVDFVSADLDAVFRRPTEKRTKAEIVARLNKGGYKFLNSGMYGQVYGNAKTVVKVGTVSNNFAYISFLKKVQANPTNPFYPVIHSVSSYFDTDIEKNVFVVFMERLKEYNSKVFPYLSELEDALCYSADRKRTMANKSLATYPQWLVNLAKDIDDLCKSPKISIDIHDGNVMLRGDQLVITDPVC